MTNSKVIFVN